MLLLTYLLTYLLQGNWKRGRLKFGTTDKTFPESSQ